MGFNVRQMITFYDDEIGEVVAFIHGSDDAKLMQRILSKSPGSRRGRPRKKRPATTDDGESK
jgi:hypothetical protein